VHLKHLSLAGLLLVLTMSAAAAAPDPLFQDHAIIKAVLTAPLTQAYAQREQDVRIYLPGQFAFVDAAGEMLRLDASIRTRGNFRRLNCQLPPLQLNFKKSQVKGTLFRGQNKLKLVAPCQHGIESQQLVLLEYLAYRTYEIMTEYSFGTRLLRLSYVDSDEKRNSWTDLVFVIEDDADVAKRLDLIKLHVARNRISQLEPFSAALVDLFQLMIANNDYSLLQSPEGVDCCHNVEMFIRDDAPDVRIPIPFDFDMSGLVNAPYAAPPSHLPIRLVRTRYYRGLCRPRGVVDAAASRIREKREAILALYESADYLGSPSRKRAIKYVAEFFELLDDPERFEAEVIERCRGDNDVKDST